MFDRSKHVNRNGKLLQVANLTLQHLHQYLARRDLRRRIALGQVDLEGLGIKRLTVPKKYVDAFSQHTWRHADTVAGTPRTEHMTAATQFDQTSCSICLEDYVQNATVVRELPCHHMFHPDCIDPFLLKRSSLCPLCKQSVLPKGYIPPDSQLTAATVMRERRRRRQARRAPQAQGTDIELQNATLNSRSGETSQQSLRDLAPDNEEEARELQQASRFRRMWLSLSLRAACSTSLVMNHDRKSSSVLRPYIDFYT